MLSPKQFQELYISMYEARDDDAKEMRRLAAAERRAGNSDRMDSKAAAKYAGSEAKSAEREDKKSKGKHIHGMADSYEANGDLVDEAKVDAGLSKDEKETARNKRAGITNHPLIGNKRGQNMHRTFAHIDQRGEKKERGSKSGDSWSTVYGKNKSGKLERKYQEYSGTNKPRIEEGIEEALDKEFGSMRKRGGRSAPPEERSVGGERNRNNKDYWADTQGANRDRGKGSAAKRKAAALNAEEFELEEGMTMKDFKAQRSKVKRSENRAADKIAPGRRAGIHNPSASPERAARHRANVDPDFEGNDERNYPGGSLKSKKVRKARAVGELTKEELELELRAHLRERALDASETKEKESVYKAIKPSKLAKSYPEKSPKELKSLRYAISTAQAKKNMDTSRSDKRYGVEG